VDGLDQLRVPPELYPQAADDDVDVPGILDLESDVGRPRDLEKSLAGEDRPRVPDERFENRELPARERCFDVVDEDFVPTDVDDERPYLEAIAKVGRGCDGHRLRQAGDLSEERGCDGSRECGNFVGRE